MTRIRVVLADDHALVRDSLANWLRSTGDIEVAAAVGSGDEAVAECLRIIPEVFVCDIDMPGLRAFDAATTVRANCPRTRILFLSAFTHDRYIREALAIEADGYVTKNERPEAIAQAIRAVAAGDGYFSDAVRARMLVGSGGVGLAPGAPLKGSNLTQRELEVLGHIARGLSKREIAEEMKLSVKTIDNHTTNLMGKLDIHDRVGLTRYAIREGLTQP